MGVQWELNERLMNWWNLDEIYQSGKVQINKRQFILK